MTDFETIKEILDRAGIQYQPADEEARDGGPAFKVEAGYAGFFALFGFSADGSLVRVEAYE